MKFKIKCDYQVGKWLEQKEADEYTKFKTQSELVKKGEGRDY